MKEKIIAVAVKCRLTGRVYAGDGFLSIHVAIACANGLEWRATIAGYVTNLRPFVNRTEAHFVATQQYPASFRTGPWDCDNILESVTFSRVEDKAAHAKRLAAQLARVARKCAAVVVLAVTLASCSPATRPPESRQYSDKSVAMPGACVLTATELAAVHPGSKIAFVRYFGQPIGHAITVYRDGSGRTYAADWRGAVAVPALAYDSALVAATFAPAPLPGYIFSTAAFVYARD